MMAWIVRTLAECCAIACHVRITRASPTNTSGINSHELLVCCNSKSSAPVPTSPKIRIVKSRRRIVKRGFGIYCLGLRTRTCHVPRQTRCAGFCVMSEPLDVGGSYNVYWIFHFPRVGFRFPLILHHDGEKNSSLTSHTGNVSATMVLT